jgi:hypothetical protein
MIKNPTNHHSFNVLVLNILLHVSAFSKCHHQAVRYEHAEMVPSVVKIREGWELYIVTDCVMVETCRSIFSTNTLNE